MLKNAIARLQVRIKISQKCVPPVTDIMCNIPYLKIPNIFPISRGGGGPLGDKGHLPTNLSKATEMATGKGHFPISVGVIILVM